MRSAVRGLVVLMLTAAVLVGCTPTQPSEPSTPANVTESKEIKIGVSAPITGSIPVVGRGTKFGAELAAEEVNAKGGLQVGDEKLPVKLIIEDSANDPKQTAAVFQKLITKDNVVAIIGDQASKCSMAGAPIAQSNGVPMVTPWSTTDAVTEGKDYVFRACFRNSDQGGVMAKYVIEDLKYKTVAMLFDINSDSLKDTAESFRANFEKLGGEVVAYETYTTGDKDFSSQLTKIKAKKPEGLFIASYYDEGGLQVKQARKLGIDVQIMAQDGWDSPELIDLGGEAMEGCLFTDHWAVDIATETAKTFIEAYQDKHDIVPDAPAALTYDAAKLLFQAIERAGSLDHKAVRDALADTDYDGVTGHIKFKEGSGDPEKDVVIVEIKDGQFTYKSMVKP